MTRAKTGWLVGGVIVTGVLVAMVVRGGSRREAPPAFVTATVDTGSIIGRVTATGTLSALVTVQVGSQVSGRIKELRVDFNASVKKGQVLAKLDPELFEAAIAQARANEQAAEGNLARAKAQAADAERKLKRATQLAEQKLIAQADLDAATAESEVALASIQAAEGSVAQARAQRHQAEVNSGYTTIISPIDGTVVSRAIDVGQTVAASLQAPTLFTIAENLSRMQVDTNVAEADVGKLREGMDASFSVDAFPGRPFRGKIRQIRFAPQVVQNVVTYDAVIDVENPELLLRPGMTANVTFVYARVDDTLRVPNAALRFRLEGASTKRPPLPERSDGGVPPGRTVYVVKQGVPTPVTVQLGITDGSATQVLSGLSEGDEVITDRQLDTSAPKPAGGLIPGQQPGPRRGF